jgi:GT2 family glycosyltransferase
MPTASIVIPTRGRTDYLDITLASVLPQAAEAGAEVLVVSDGVDPRARAVAERRGAGFLELARPAGLNAARNAGREATHGELVVFIDDDTYAPAGWLGALLEGVRGAPDHDVFGGPIRARLEDGGPHGCGREPAPITTLDLGSSDRDVPLVWGANMAIRRRAFERVGGFDEAITGRGDEEEWERRYRARGGRVRYIAAGGLDHRRTREDASVRALALADYRLGRTARRNDVRKHAAPPLRDEVRTLAGCAYHVLRRHCAIGIVLAAHAAGRLREALSEPTAERHAGPPSDFLSGTSGQVFGIRRTVAAMALDAWGDAMARAQIQPARLRRAAAAGPRRRVLVLSITREGVPNVLAAARRELLRSHHQVTFVSAPAGDRGKFENLNRLLERNPADGHDWLIVIDDDVALPSDFLDDFVFLAERFDLRLAQPAHRACSHAAWQVTRRRPGSVARQTLYVEIGPVTAFQAVTFDRLLPFPDLRAGWGLDLHWSALAREHGWRQGIIDATPIRHGVRLIAASYDRDAAIDEAREFLATRPYTNATDAQRTLATHRTWQ